MTAAMAGAPDARPQSLIRDRDFASVLIGQGVSAMGSAVTMVAMPLLVLLMTGSGLLMGVVGILETLPDLVVGLPAGAYADRWDRRRVMIAADAGRALLTALIPLAVMAGVPVVPVILIVVAPINALRVMFSAAQNASVPTLAGRDRLSQGAAYFEVVWGLGYVLGPAVAGLLIAIVGPGPTIGLDALSFAFSAGSVILVRRSLKPPPSETPTRSIVSDVREGLAFVRGNRSLGLTIAFYASLSLLMAPFVPAFTYFLIRDRGMDSAGLGLMISVFSIGMVAGALAATRLDGRRLGMRMLAAALATGAGLAIGWAMPSAFLLGVLGLAMGACWTMVEVSYVALRMAASPEALLARVSTIARTATVGAQPIGMLVGGLLIDRVGGGATLAVMGTAAMVATVVFGMSASIRSASAQGEPEQPAAGVVPALASAVMQQEGL